MPKKDSKERDWRNAELKDQIESACDDLYDAIVSIGLLRDRLEEELVQKSNKQKTKALRFAKQK